MRSNSFSAPLSRRLTVLGWIAFVTVVASVFVQHFM
jgi:hypothetical protein